LILKRGAAGQPELVLFAGDDAQKEP